MSLVIGTLLADYRVLCDSVLNYIMNRLWADKSQSIQNT